MKRYSATFATLSFMWILFFLLKDVNCQEEVSLVDSSESSNVDANGTLATEGVSEENGTEIQQPRTCAPKVRPYLLEITRTLYQTEFLPNQTLIMKNYIHEEFGWINATLEENQEKVSALENKVDQSEEKADHLEDKFARQIREVERKFGNQISNLENKITTLENENAALKESLAQQTQRVNDMGTKVIFGVMKKTSNSGNVKGKITFSEEIIDVGGGFDLRNDVFRTPISGAYRFTFSGQSGASKNEYTGIQIKKNGVRTLDIYDDNEQGDVNNLSYTWLMKLRQGDTLELYSLNHLYVFSYNPLTFTGELIHK